MKRLMIAVMAVGLLVAFSLARPVAAKGPKGPPQRVLIAHLCETVVTVDEETGVTTTVDYFKVIEVSERAADAHLAHGDLTAEEAEAYLDDVVKGATFEIVDEEPAPAE
jgi:hypothetical protein